jgi:two-component system cell cycle sensor histidine kinase/response regulator CckA
VWAYSEPGQGTTFKVYLATSTEPLDTGQAEADREQSASGELILVVEDEEQVRKIAGRALQDAGYQVREASSGREALEILTAGDRRVALVLTDVVMPGMTGKELAASITEVAPTTPVLFISGYTDGEIVRRGLLSPDAALVQKPFTPNGLVKAVKERLAAQVASQMARLRS